MNKKERKTLRARGTKTRTERRNMTQKRAFIHHLCLSFKSTSRSNSGSANAYEMSTNTHTHIHTEKLNKWDTWIEKFPTTKAACVSKWESENGKRDKRVKREREREEHRRRTLRKINSNTQMFATLSTCSRLCTLSLFSFSSMIFNF